MHQYSQSTQYFYNNLHVLNASAMQEYGLNELSNEVKLIDSEIIVETNDLMKLKYILQKGLVHVSKTKSIIVEDWIWDICCDSFF